MILYIINAAVFSPLSSLLVLTRSGRMEITMKKIIAMLLSLTMVISLTACGSGSTSSSDAEVNSSGVSGASSDTNSFTPVTWRFANQQGVDQPATRIDQQICDEINEASAGRITVELYPNQALGDYTSVFDELMLGTIEMAHISPVESYDNRVSATMIPYLGTDYETLLRAYRRDGYLFSQVEEALGHLDIRLMGIFCEGYNGVGTTTPIQNAATVGADKGVIIRSPMMDTYALDLMNLGFRVSSMPFSDTYTAAQTGVVQGWAGAGVTGNYFVFRDLIKHFYDYRHTQEATMIMVSDTAWQTLLPQDQEAITGIIGRACESSAQVAQEADAKSATELEAMGVEIVNFTGEELQAFTDSCHQNVWPQLSANYPKEFLDNILADIEQ